MYGARRLDAVQEPVGHCSKCGTSIYCKDGFLDGVVNEDQTLVCFDCRDERAENERPS